MEAAPEPRLSYLKDYSSTNIHTSWGASAMRMMPYGSTTKHALRLCYSSEISYTEAVWRDRYEFLLSRGYKLRPRYRPGWTASWVGTSVEPWECEDAIEQLLPMVLDATRQSDGTKVCIKRAIRNSKEVDIIKYLTSEHLRSSRNHSMSIFETFADPEVPHVQYILMPLLRSFDDPDFGAVGEVVDFVSQLLEGMAFLHDHLIAHCDLTGVNIMMDAQPIFPDGWHFSSPYLAPDGITAAKPLTRIDYPVRYYIIDFDFAMQLQPGQSHLVNDFGGRDNDPPELSRNKPYDPFKLDVFTLANCFKKDIYRKYFELEFLKQLTDYMMTHDFRDRPTAKEAISLFSKVRPTSGLRRRLPRRIETQAERVVYDVVSAAREGIYNVAQILKGEHQSGPGNVNKSSGYTT